MVGLDTDDDMVDRKLGRAYSESQIFDVWVKLNLAEVIREGHIIDKVFSKCLQHTNSHAQNNAENQAVVFEVGLPEHTCVFLQWVHEFTLISGKEVVGFACHNFTQFAKRSKNYE